MLVPTHEPGHGLAVRGYGIERSGMQPVTLGQDWPNGGRVAAALDALSTGGRQAGKCGQRNDGAGPMKPAPGDP